MRAHCLRQKATWLRNRKSQQPRKFLPRQLFFGPAESNYRWNLLRLRVCLMMQFLLSALVLSLFSAPVWAETKGGCIPSKYWMCIQDDSEEEGRYVLVWVGRLKQLVRDCDHSPRACLLAGDIYNIALPPHGSIDTAIEFYHRGCDAGEFAACNELIRVFKKQGKMAEGLKAAETWCNHGGINGCIDIGALACTNPGRMFKHGRGVEKGVLPGLQ